MGSPVTMRASDEPLHVCNGYMTVTAVSHTPRMVRSPGTAGEFMQNCKARNVKKVAKVRKPLLCFCVSVDLSVDVFPAVIPAVIPAAAR